MSGSGELKRDPHAGYLYVFGGRRGDLIKIIWHGGKGACLFAKRLEDGEPWDLPDQRSEVILVGSSIGS